MNTQAKILRIALGAALAASAGVMSAAHASGDQIDAPVQALPMTEVMIDAARAFEAVDTNKDGLVDAEEYVSQRVVRAQLARFTREIRIEGRQDLVVAVPEGVATRMTEPERAALDTVTRNDFSLRVAGAEGLTPAQWQDVRLEAFTLADLDASGALEGDELAGFAAFLAGSLSIGQPGS